MCKILIFLFLELILAASLGFSFGSKSNRKLSLPHGSHIVVTSELDFPLLDPGSPGSLFGSAVGSNFRIVLPISIDLSAVEERYTKFMENQMMVLGDILWPSWWMKYSSKRQPRSIKNHNLDDRLLIFAKFETLLETIGLPGRPCLMRTICEIHEFPYWNAYGLAGELITTLFRIGSGSDITESNLNEHLTAQQLGNDGNCYNYTKSCSKSLFVLST